VVVAKAVKVNLEIEQGRTFSQTIAPSQSRFAYRQIQAATQAAPCIITTSAPHGLPDGWLFAISDAKGMVELNSPQDEDCRPLPNYSAIVIDEATLELNDLNASAFRPYSGGGIITYKLPMDLSGFTAAAQVRKTIDSEEVLLSLTTENGGIVIDEADATITLQATAVQTAAIDWLDGVWDLEITSADGIVTAVAAGSVKVIREVTR
jgi:hypothetical protein